MVIRNIAASVIIEPSDEEIEKIKNKLGENKEKFEHQLKLLYEWSDKNEDIPKNYDKNIVKNFFRACRYDMEKSKQALQAHFYVRYEFPHIFKNLDPLQDELRELTENGNALFLPRLTPKGERIFLLNVQNPDVNKMDVMAFVKYSFMCYDLSLRETFPTVGDVMILDGSRFSMKHFLKCINTAVKDSISISYKGYVVRMRKIYIVNTPPSVDKMIATWKLFLKEKMRSRIVASKTYDIVEEDIPKYCLPEEYGGTLPKINDIMKNWYNYLVENKEWFHVQETCFSTNRPNNEKYKLNDKFGVEGSFRKLNID